MINSKTRNMKWQPTTERIGGFRCIKSEVSGEVRLQGHNGDIWPYDGNGRNSALITNHRAANKLFRRLGKKGVYEMGEEALLTAFSENILSEVMSAIRLIKRQKMQIKKANEMNDPNFETAPLTIQNASELASEGVSLSPNANDENRPPFCEFLDFGHVKKGA